MNNAIVLCSGGIDSVVTAYFVKRKNYDRLIFLFFDYGQRALNGERKASKFFANELNADFVEAKISLFDDSSLTREEEYKKVSREELRNTKIESSKFYVPNRNSIFLSYAISLSETLGGADIFVGFNSEGQEAYPDTTKGFVDKTNELIKVTDIGSEVKAPFIESDKDEIIKEGVEFNVNLAETISCYTGSVHCGVCLACRLRQEAFYWANIKDKTRYQEMPEDYRAV